MLPCEPDCLGAWKEGDLLRKMKGDISVDGGKTCLTWAGPQLDGQLGCPLALRVFSVFQHDLKARPLFQPYSAKLLKWSLNLMNKLFY